MVKISGKPLIGKKLWNINYRIAMRKAILMMLLILINTSVVAEWTLVLAGKESTEYVDLATIRVSGNIAKMWTLTNISKNIEYIKPGNKAFAVKTVHEYDCKEHQSRLIFVAWYNEYMGTGGVDHSANSPNSKWSPVVPGSNSIKEIRWEIACGQKGKQLKPDCFGIGFKCGIRRGSDLHPNIPGTSYRDYSEPSPLSLKIIALSARAPQA